MTDKQLMQYLPIHSGEDWRMLPDCSKLQMSECPDVMATSSTKQIGPNHGQTLKIQWFLLKDTLYGHHTICGRQFEEVFHWNLTLGKSTELGLSHLFTKNPNKACSHRKNAD